MGNKRIIAFDNNGRPTYSFNTMGECMKKLNISPYNLKEAIEKGKRDHQTGLFFDYELKPSDLYDS